MSDEPPHFDGKYPSIEAYCTHLNWEVREYMRKLDMKDKTVVPFQVLEGGKPTGQGDWLGALPIGSIFLYQEKGTEVDLIPASVNLKKGQAVMIYVNIPNGPAYARWVRSAAFSKRNEFVESIGEFVDDGESNRSDPAGGLENNDNATEVDPSLQKD